MKTNKKKLNGEIIYEMNLKKSPIGVALAEIKFSKEHFHKNMTEWYYVIRGRGKIYLNGRMRILRKNNFLMIRPNTRHYVKRVGRQNLKVLVISYPPWNKKDHHLVR